MGEGTRCVTVSDSELLDMALARIDVIEARVDALQVMAAEAFAALDSLDTRVTHATQVAEAA